MSDYIPRLASDRSLAWTQLKAVNTRQRATYHPAHSCWLFNGCTNMITKDRSCSWQKNEKHCLHHFDKEYAYYFCRNCDKKFTTKDHVNTHIKGTKHAPARPECRGATRFRCPAPGCGELFDWEREREFYNHIADSHGRCYLCREIIPDGKNLESHMQEHKNEFQKRKILARKDVSSSSSGDAYVYNEQCRDLRKRNRDRESIINGKRSEKERKISTPNVANQQADYAAEKEGENGAKIQAENTTHIQNGRLIHDTETLRMGHTLSNTKMSETSSAERFPRCFSTPLHSSSKAEYEEMDDSDVFEMSLNTMTMSHENLLQQKDDFSMLPPLPFPQIGDNRLSNISNGRHEMDIFSLPDWTMSDLPTFKLDELDEEFCQPGGVPIPKSTKQRNQQKTQRLQPQQPAPQQTKSLVHSNIYEIFKPSNGAQSGNLNLGQASGNGNSVLGDTPSNMDNIPRNLYSQSMDARQETAHDGNLGGQKIDDIADRSDSSCVGWEGLHTWTCDLMDTPSHEIFSCRAPVSQDPELTSILDFLEETPPLDASNSIKDHRDSKPDNKTPIEKISCGVLQLRPEISRWTVCDTQDTSGEPFGGGTSVPNLGSVYPQSDFVGLNSSPIAPGTSGFRMSFTF